MRLAIVANVVANEYDEHRVDAQFVGEYIAGMHQPRIVPGIVSWDNVATTDGAHPSGDRFVAISADLSGADEEEVPPEIVRAHIAEAGANWLVPGALVAPADQIVVS